MPLPDHAELQRRALAHARAQSGVAFDPITLLIVSAILSAVISHLVQKCLNQIDPATARAPGVLRRWQFRRLVRRSCGSRAVLEAARSGGLAADAIDRTWGDAVYHALLATGAALSEPEAVALFQGR